MKILVVSSEFPPGPGGIGNHAYSLCKFLVAAGHKVHLVADSNYATQSEVMEFDRNMKYPMVIKRIERKGWITYINRIKAIRSQLNTNEFDGIIYSGKFSLWMCGLFNSLGVKMKTLAVLHGSEVKPTNLLLKLVTNWGIKNADYLVPVSGFTHGLLNENLQKRPFEIIPNGIDLDEFEDLNKASEQLSYELSGDPVLLTVGNVTPRKGQHRIIKAMPSILEQYPGAHYHIVGLPSYQKEFEEIAKHLGVSDAVTFHGRLPQREHLACVYKQADCFMILSENQEDGDVEGFGIVILEANYFGLPSIGANGCGIVDAIDHKKSGILVDGDQPDEIVEALNAIISNKQSFGMESLSWVKKHDWKVIVDRYINILERGIKR